MKKKKPKKWPKSLLLALDAYHFAVKEFGAAMVVFRAGFGGEPSEYRHKVITTYSKLRDEIEKVMK